MLHLASDYPGGVRCYRCHTPIEGVVYEELDGYIPPDDLEPEGYEVVTLICETCVTQLAY